MKTILKRISAGALAAVFLTTLAVPRSKAVVEGFDIVAVANAVVDTHLAALGGEFVIKTGGSSALAAGTESLFTQAGAAGAFGAGVSGATAMGTIAAGVSAFAGGYLLGTAAYEVVTQFVDWLRENKLISDGENTIYQTGGSFDRLTDGRPVQWANCEFGKIYTTQAGSSFMVSFRNDGEYYDYLGIGLTPDNEVHTSSASTMQLDIFPTGKGYYILGYSAKILSIGKSSALEHQIDIPPLPTSDNPFPWNNVFSPSDSSAQREKREVTYMPPATWSPPVPKPGQSVLYKPFPNAPDKGLEDIIADVPEAIASGNFKPATSTVIDTPTPEPPPTPDVPPTVNPNPDVEAPEDVTPYTVKIGEVFPFCIPFDLYHMVTMFSAEPEAPHAKWTFSLPWSPAQEYKVEWDLKKFDELAELCRKLELVLFCVGLAVVTSKLIKW